MIDKHTGEKYFKKLGHKKLKMQQITEIRDPAYIFSQPLVPPS
jgi:hypothetical protein